MLRDKLRRIGILVIGGQKIRNALMENISKHKEFNIYFMPGIEISEIKKQIREKSDYLKKTLNNIIKALEL